MLYQREYNTLKQIQRFEIAHHSKDNIIFFQHSYKPAHYNDRNLSKRKVMIYPKCTMYAKEN